MNESEPLEETYECAFDPSRHKAFVRAYLRANVRKVLAYSAQWGVLFAGVGTLAFWIAQFYVQKGEPLSGISITIGLMLVAGIGYYWYTSSRANETMASQYAHEVWTCSILDDCWTYRDRSGVETRIPWKTMKLTFEHPNAWYISYGKTQVIVYRGPLRIAGLEEEFRNRIGLGSS